MDGTDIVVSLYPHQIIFKIRAETDAAALYDTYSYKTLNFTILACESIGLIG